MTEIGSQRRLAARLAARAQLRDVRLLSDHTELLQLPSEDAGALGYDIDIDARPDWDGASPNFVVQCVYTVTLDQKPTEIESDDEPAVLATMSFTFAGLFGLEMRAQDDPPTGDELAAYASTTALFAVYPFAREYVRDMTSRMSLPPLTLNVFLQPVDAKEIGTGPDAAALTAGSGE